MNRKYITDPQFPACPIRNVLSRISDKWSILVLLTLNNAEHGFIRFKELQRSIPDISQKMLTTTLRTLEEDGLVRRKVYPEVPPRVEYSITHRTETLLPHVYALIDWANDNKSDIIADRQAAQ